MRKIILIAFLFFVGSIFSKRSEASISEFNKVLQVDKENKNLKIQNLLQDYQGFIWVGTDHGLYQFDGFDFEKYIADSNKLKASISSIYQDKSQTIWVGTEEGKLFRRRSDKFKEVSTPFHSSVKAIINYSPDELWIATYGEGIYSFKNDQWKKVLSGDAQFIYVMVITADNSVLVGTDIGLLKYTYGNKVYIINTKSGLPENIVREIKLLNNSKAILGFEEAGVYYMDLNNNQFAKPGNLSSWNLGSVNEINFNNNECWVGTEKNGMVSFSTSYSGQVKFYNSTNGFEYTKISYSIFDREGNLWIAADNKLIFRPAKKIEFINNQQGDFDDIQAITNDPEGFLWYANKNGLFKFDNNNPGFSAQKINIPTISKLHIISLFLDDWGYLWIGTFDNGLYRLNTYNNEIKKFGLSDGLKNANIVSIQGKDNKIWLATLGGLSECTINEAKNNPGSLTYTFKSFGGTSSPGEIFVYDVFVDSKNRVWFGTDGKGLSCVDRGKFKSFNTIDNKTNIVVYSITEDKKGHIWFSTLNHGVYRYDGKIFYHIGIKEGLRDNEITGVITDWQGNIIVVHSKGIDKINANTFEIDYLGAESGIENLNCNLNALCNDANGNIWIGKQDGLMRLIKSRYSEVTKPTTCIRRIYAFMKHGLSAKDSIFEYNQNQISLAFIGLWYANPEAVHYRYRLIGLSNQWISTKDKIITFPNLPPGKYTFELESSVNNLFINPSSATYSFKINKPLTKQWWFISLIIFLSAAALIWYIRDRDIRFRNLEAMKKEKMEYQYETLKSQINPHFLFNSFNTLITIIEDNKDKAVDYVETLSDYFRSMLNYRDKDVIRLSEELDIVSTYFYLQQKRFGEHLSLSINVTSKYQEEVSVPPLSIQLLVENAIKHNAVSHETPLKIDITIDDKNQFLIVSNNLNPKKKHDPSTGIGLNNIFSRYKILTQQDVTVIRTDEQFIVELPLIKNKI
ncbi:MAG: two-component regulator propeller domain-containing protein [Bacteroidota bacterium]|jgi:ligand-binding sensor domain-containing protein